MNKAGSLKWSRDAMLLGDENDRQMAPFPRYSMVGGSKESFNLLIRNTSLSDEGVYKCQVSKFQRHQQLQKITYLTVVGQFLLLFVVVIVVVVVVVEVLIGAFVTVEEGGMPLTLNVIMLC